MSLKKGTEQVLIIVGAAFIVGIVTWAIVTIIFVDKTQGKHNYKIQSIENKMIKFEKKQDKIMENTTKTNSKIDIVNNNVMHLTESVKMLTAQVKSAYATKIQRMNAENRTIAQNDLIASAP